MSLKSLSISLLLLMSWIEIGCSTEEPEEFMVDETPEEIEEETPTAEVELQTTIYTIHEKQYLFKHDYLFL